MPELLKPKIHIKTVYQLDTDLLKKNNIKGIIIDIDNTLVAWDARDLDEKTKAFIKDLRKKGFNIGILSNSTKKRVARLNKDLRLPAVCNACKPWKYSYKKAMKIMNIYASNTAVIGDQIFTDILGGNILGLYTILVDPISSKEFFWTRLMRMAEALVLKRNNFSK
ncbi:MAG: YqeG family HAD IIIA-type phosphatase [Clostridiales bacterium]|nr:YqeG family HAD IIIA-type phosphatase [Clostridiales bacterium]